MTELFGSCNPLPGENNNDKQANYWAWQIHTELGPGATQNFVFFPMRCISTQGPLAWALGSSFSHTYLILFLGPSSCPWPLRPLCSPFRASRNPIPFIPMSSWRETGRIPPERGLWDLKQNIRSLTNSSLGDNVISPLIAPLPWATTHGSVSLFSLSYEHMLPYKRGVKKKRIGERWIFVSSLGSQDTKEAAVRLEAKNSGQSPSPAFTKAIPALTRGSSLTNYEATLCNYIIFLKSYYKRYCTYIIDLQ